VASSTSGSTWSRSPTVRTRRRRSPAARPSPSSSSRTASTSWNPATRSCARSWTAPASDPSPRPVAQVRRRGPVQGETWARGALGAHYRGMRAVWKGAVTFGLVNVPVKLYSATEDHDVPLHQVHDADGGRIRYKRVCEIDGEVVPYEHIDRAYDDGERTVVLTKKEL